MDLDAFNERRSRLNARLSQADPFFAAFGTLDEEAYRDGALPARTKELIGLALSVAARCDECVAYHVQQAREYDIAADEATEAVKLGVLAAGSLAYSVARNAIELIDDVLAGGPEQSAQVGA
jgi:AhpD family alkylhydroperoxidase